MLSGGGKYVEQKKKKKGSSGEIVEKPRQCRKMKMG